MNKIIQVALNFIRRNLNLKSLIYILFILLSSLIFFFISTSNLHSNLNENDLRVWDSNYSGAFLIVGLLWIIGIPFFVYLSFFLAKSISDEVSSGTALLILTRPVSRKEFILGKFFGITFFFTLINGIILFTLPPIINLLGVSAVYIPSLMLTSLALFFYGIILCFVFSAIGIFFSSTINKNLISVSLLFILIILSFFVPFIFSSMNKDIFFPLKPFSFILDLFPLKFTPSSISLIDSFFDSFYWSNTIIIANPVSPILFFLISFIFPVVTILFCLYLFSKRDIT
jgi:ABC-type transport system involved in multi-copper enzyme maturation permease subunit